MSPPLTLDIARLHQRVADEMEIYDDKAMRELLAEARIVRFQQGATGAGISLSQMTFATAHHQVQLALSERRDTKQAADCS